MRKKQSTVIKVAILGLVVLLYIAVYAYQYSEAVKPDIRYYDKGVVIDNFGLSYGVTGCVYSKEQFIEKYDIEEYKMLDMSSDYEKKYIVIEEKITKTSDEIQKEPNDYRKMGIYSKFWQIGDEIELSEELSKNSDSGVEGLNVGETVTTYRVFSIASCNLSRRLWKKVEKTEVWFEFKDTEVCPYIRRVKVLN